MGDTVDALKLKIKEQGGSTAGVHTIPQAIERIEFNSNGNSKVLDVVFQNETIKVSKKR